MTAEGVVDLASFDASLGDDTAIATVMWVNNEIGTVQPIERARAGAPRARGALFHTDAVQAFGKIAIDAKAIPFDVLSVSGHKIGAPEGHRRDVHSPRHGDRAAASRRLAGPRTSPGHRERGVRRRIRARRRAGGRRARGRVRSASSELRDAPRGGDPRRAFPTR